MRLRIRVKPGAHEEKVSREPNGSLLVSVTARAQEGKANEALVEFLSEVLAVPPSRIEIVAGQTGRDKLVSILDLDAKTVHERILKKLA